MIWNHDITAAPRGKTISSQRLVKDKNSASGESLRTFTEFRRELILAVNKSGTVVQTYWIPPNHSQSGVLLEGNRWSGFNVGSDPIAWAPWPTYEMHERPSINDKPYLKAVPQDAPSPAGIGSELLAGREGRHEGEAASVGLPTNLQLIDDCGSGA